jgi:SAM-dependent methyltransferase
MLSKLKKQYPYAKTLLGDVRDLTLPNMSINVVFVNACYPNIVDKRRSIANLGRMMKRGGRLVISHPMGKSFIDGLRPRSPFPLDDFPEKTEAESLLQPHGFEMLEFIDEPNLYILVATRDGGR